MSGTAKGNIGELKIKERPPVVGYYMLGDFGFGQPKKPNWFQRWCMKWILGLIWSDEWKGR